MLYRDNDETGSKISYLLFLSVIIFGFLDTLILVPNIISDQNSLIALYDNYNFFFVLQ